MLYDGRLPGIPLLACISVFFNSRLSLMPLHFPSIHLTTLAGDLVDHTCNTLFAAPLEAWSPVKVSLIFNSAHLKMGMTVLNWWVWSTKVGVAAKFFPPTSRAHYQAPSYVNSWIHPRLQLWHSMMFMKMIICVHAWGRQFFKPLFPVLQSYTWKCKLFYV